MSLPTHVHPLTSSFSLDHILSNAADGVFVIDRQRRYVLVNAALERLTGFASRELIAQACTCSEMTNCRDEHGRYLSGFLCPARAVLDGEQTQSLQRMQISRADGSTVWVETHYSPIRSESGRIDFVLGVVRDVSDSKAHFDELKADMSNLRKQLDDHISPNKPFTGPADAVSSTNPCERAPTSPQQGPTSAMPLDRILEDVERREILRALEIAGGQRTHAAKIMGISRSRLYRRLDALGIDQAHLD